MMQVFRFGLGVLIGLQLLWAGAAATSLNGTTSIVYQRANYVFRSADNARGFVRLNNGFTVLPNASVFMDTVVSASGGFDLRDTGTLILMGNLTLDCPVTLTSSGNIKGRASVTGQANTIFMGGDLTLASDSYARTLHIIGDWSKSGTSGDLIIDGCGHTLDIGDRAQIFVDQNITLTLRNMTIKTGPKSLNNPAIQLASHGSKLALDNVMFDLGADFHFIQGQIFIHDEVAVTGTSAFVYQSPKPSYITSGATWSFEQGTTFSVAPATYTDIPYTAGTATSNNFIVLADQTAALSLNGCSFKTTFTGLRLAKGMMSFDNRVVIDTTAGMDLNNTTPVRPSYLAQVSTLASPSCASWSPDGRFLAVSSAGYLEVYRFSGGNALTLVGSVGFGSFFSVAWSPDGRFLAVVDWGGNTLSIYRFDGSNTLNLLGTVGTGNRPTSVSWSPDGRFLAVVNYNDNTLSIYRFNGSKTPILLGTVGTPGSGPQSVVWSPDGRFLAVVTSADARIAVYRFNGSNTPDLLVAVLSLEGSCYSVSWSPDGRFLAVVNYGYGLLRVYRFDGSNVLIQLGDPVFGGYFLRSGVWSPDGRFLAVVNETSKILQVYRFNGSDTPIPLGTVGTGTDPYSVAWSPDGLFLAVVNNGSQTLQVFGCNYVYSSQLTQQPQGFSNGLLFGDSAKGSAYNANVQINGGARVELTGKIKDDSA